MLGKEMKDFCIGVMNRYVIVFNSYWIEYLICLLIMIDRYFLKCLIIIIYWVIYLLIVYFKYIV